MRKHISTFTILAGALLIAAGSASARETQLGGVKLGRSADVVTDHYGDPTRTHSGALPTGTAGAPGMPGMPGAEMSSSGSPMMAPGMEGMSMAPGMSGMPGMPGMPGMSGMPGMPGMSGAAAPARQKYQGKIAAMQPEEFAGKLLAQPAANPALGGEMGAALGPGAPGMMSGAPGMMPGAPGMMPGMSPTMPGMSPEMSGMSGMPGAPGQAEAAPSLITWVYERANEGVTYVFGFSEEGRVSLVCVGDDKPYSICKGGRKPAFGGVKTSKGIKLGSSFKAVVATYGYPESTEVIGDEVLMKYFERFGVAFTFKQNIMRVTSIAIKSPEE